MFAETEGDGARRPDGGCAVHAEQSDPGSGRCQASYCAASGYEASGVPMLLTAIGQLSFVTDARKSPFSTCKLRQDNHGSHR